MLNTFASIIKPLSVKEFAENYYSKKALYIKNESDKFKGFFTWETLNKMIDTSVTDNFVLALHPNLASTTWNHNRKKIDELIFKGYSVKLSDIENFSLEIKKLAVNLANELKTEIKIGLYASASDKPAFPIHFNTYDVIIIQLEGLKKWQILNHEVPYIKPNFRKETLKKSYPKEWDIWKGTDLGEDYLFPEESFTSDYEPYIETILSPGDVLYVPGGCRYKEEPAKEPSLHITISIANKTGMDFFILLKEKLSQNKIIQRSIPLNIKENIPENENDTEWKKFIANIKEAFSEEFKTDLLQKKIQEDFLLKHESASLFNFPYHYIVDTITPSTEKKFSKNTCEYIIIPENENSFNVIVNGQSISVNNNFEPFINYIFKVQNFTLQEIYEKMPHISFSSMLKILNMLIKNNIVTISDK